MNRLTLVLSTLVLPVLLTSCEKDTDLFSELCAYSDCFASSELASKNYEITIGNRVRYSENGQVYHSNSDGDVLFKGLDTTTIKRDLSKLNQNLELTLIGSYKVIEVDATLEKEITKSLNLTTKTDQNGYFSFKINHQTNPGMIISEVKDLDFKIIANIDQNNKMVSSIGFSNSSAWSTMLGFFDVLAVYDITSGKYDCSADLCTWIDLGGDLVLKRQSAL